MKSNFLFMSVLASLFVAGCSHNGMDPNGEDDGKTETDVSYIAVNMVSSDIAGTRAATGYEDGTEDENQVSSARFYFFTANGEIANVKRKGSSYINYYDWTPESQSPDEASDDAVEKRLAATIVINTTQGDKIPQTIVAILNPDPDVLNNDSKTLGDLKEIVNNYTKPTVTQSGKFVMCNSVYTNTGKSSEFCAVTITGDNLRKSKDDAKDHPVTIHVERCVAKVRVSFAENLFTNGKLALTDKDGREISVDGKPVYLKIDAWGLTADTDMGRLVKKINLGWPTTWWISGAFRSFWATNAERAINQYYDYKHIVQPITNALYTNENAAPVAGGVENRTKVILKGTLCNEAGNSLTLVRHLGVLYADTYSETPSANLPVLKRSILAQLAASGNNYYYQEGDTRKQINTNDLKIVPATQILQEGSKNNCYVYAQLTDEAKGKTWYSSLTGDALTDAATTINNTLKNKEVVDWPLVWKDGQTYYYYEIIHHGSGETAQKGVVRNHIYDTKVTGIAGLGTPVYDPDEKIYPEKPEANDHFIAAQINILSWRVVENDYKLEW